MLQVHASIFACLHRFANSQYGEISRQTLQNKMSPVGADSLRWRSFKNVEAIGSSVQQSKMARQPVLKTSLTCRQCWGGTEMQLSHTYT